MAKDDKTLQHIALEKKNELPQHQLTSLGKGIWKSKKPELIPQEGDEINMPEHNSPKHHPAPKV